MSEIIFNKYNKLNEITDSPIVRMEVIKEAAALFGLPKHLVRTLALEGKVKAVRVSNSPNSKILVKSVTGRDISGSALKNHFVTGSTGSHTEHIQPIPVRL